MTALVREPVFTALTRPQMFAGVTYNVFLVNALLAMQMFLITKSFWVIPVAFACHLVAGALSLREPRVFDLWLLRLRRAPRLGNFARWRCNSYRP